MMYTTPRSRKLPPDAEVLRLVQAGETERQIAYAYDVKPYSVTRALRRAEADAQRGPSEDIHRIVVRRGGAKVSLPRLNIFPTQEPAS